MTVLQELVEIVPRLAIDEQRRVLDVAIALRDKQNVPSLAFPPAGADDATWDELGDQVRARSAIVLEREKERLHALGLIDEHWNELTDDLPPDIRASSRAAVSTASTSTCGPRPSTAVVPEHPARRSRSSPEELRGAHRGALGGGEELRGGDHSSLRLFARAAAPIRRWQQADWRCIDGSLPPVEWLSIEANVDEQERVMLALASSALSREELLAWLEKRIRPVEDRA